MAPYKLFQLLHHNVHFFCVLTKIIELNQKCKKNQLQIKNLWLLLKSNPISGWAASLWFVEFPSPVPQSDLTTQISFKFVVFQKILLIISKARHWLMEAGKNFGTVMPTLVLCKYLMWKTCGIEFNILHILQLIYFY